MNSQIVLISKEHKVLSSPFFILVIPFLHSEKPGPVIHDISLLNPQTHKVLSGLLKSSSLSRLSSLPRVPFCI